MKKILIGILAATVSVHAFSQKALTNLEDSASYAIGLSVANFYKSQGATSLNAELVAKAVKDIFSANQTDLPVSEIDAIVNMFFNKIQDELIKPTVEAGNAFLEANKFKPGIKITESGLQYEIIRQGDGAKPTATSKVVCHYKGTLLDGSEFDNSYNRGQPLSIGVNQVIKGWTEGLQLMPVGSHYKFYIPYDLGYGRRGSPPAIPGGSLLVFEVELLEVQ